MVLSAYVHIPFCSHKCDFCDFAAFAGVNHLEDEYTNVVCLEIRERIAHESGVQPLRSIFYGGGTPGLVKPESIAAIQDELAGAIGIAPGAEISLETTPQATSADKARAWLEAGINRISIGIESLLDQELEAIGRDHCRRQALDSIDSVCSAGFANVSCDFMYGLPTQTVDSWRHTLTEFVRIADKFPQIRHVSAYGLHIANNAPLYSRFPKNSPLYPDDELFDEMYRQMVSILAAAGFKQYEISNFARPGYESVHNLVYWRNEEYYGFGVSAHRYVEGVRSSNYRSLAKYMRDCLFDETREVIDSRTRIQEAIMLGLRLRAGIDLADFNNQFGFDLLRERCRSIAKFESAGFLEQANGWLRITDLGVPVSNSIICELM